MNVYDFTVKKINNQDLSLSEYRGKVLLIVNTATHCGFTHQYEELQELYEAHSDDGFLILDFPCGQFGSRTEETNEEIFRFCLGHYGVTFPQFAKTDVVGENADPLFQWLSENSRFQGFHGVSGMILSGKVKKQDKGFRKNNKIKWDFTKFLVGRDGQVHARFEPTVSMRAVKKQVETLL